MARSEDAPNWDDYRLSMGRIEALTDISTQVHARCHRDFVSSPDDYIFGDVELITQDFYGYLLDIGGANPIVFPQRLEAMMEPILTIRWYQGTCCGGHWHGSDVSGVLPNPTPSEDLLPGMNVFQTDHLCHTSAGEIVWMVRNYSKQAGAESLRKFSIVSR